MESLVHVREATIVTPSEPTPTEVLSLSALDSQLFLRFTIEYLLVYKPEPGFEPRAVTARFKAALAKALVSYYPLAGRVRAKVDDGSTDLEVVCGAQGVLFIEAVSDHDVNEFDRAPRFVTQWRKLLSFHVADVLKGAPPLVVQLTWLNDGNAALGVGINHCLCDGIGSAEFLNSFAELTSTCQSSFAELKFAPKPIWDRHLLNPPLFKPSVNNNNNSLCHLEFNRVPDLCGFLHRFSSERLVPTSFIFNKTSLNELRKIVFSTSRVDESYYTSFEVLSAHIWRSWARALNLPSNQILKLLFSINVRDRVKPSLPRGYYGNAFVLGCAQSSVKDLTEKGLGYAAMQVKRAKERVDSEFVKSVVESLSQRRASPDSVGVLILSQWSRLGLEKVEVGGMGKPVHVGPICCDRYCLLLPVINQTDAVKAMVAVPSSAAHTYQHLIRSFSS
ncbi:hypothetical protein like AT2G40230 [Hibiscus trionum]|uniref:Taxadien-5-alpha-ol O-acetyltransferase n=1 Tax=Hibiscus trionum TaxID=183268 RepID=A0A9W7HM69_HIBTR|nr:hypothetical protein like AT2G40230 [Hibiscus trionum]